MASAACLEPSDEKSYSFRLLSLIIDGGTFVLRYKFDQLLPPNVLQKKLNESQIRAKLNSLRNKNVIKHEQWMLLYPTTGGQPESINFDISLLSCLLKHVCGLDETSHSWTGIPSSRDVSIEADITRLRKYRNELSHMKVLKLTKEVFHRKWGVIEQVILRLGNGIPNLQVQIDKLKSHSLDPSKESELLKTIKEWEQMDENNRQEIDDIKSDIKSHGTRIDVLDLKQEKTQSLLVGLSDDLSTNSEKVSNIALKQNDLEESAKRHEESHLNICESLSENDLQVQTLSNQFVQMQAQHKTQYEINHQRLVSRTNWFISYVLCDKVYVKTNAYDSAKEKLKQFRCLVVTGFPGEGKTTMATKLMCEMANSQNQRVHLKDPNDWIIRKKSKCVILIDDIFGEGVFKESSFNKWSKVLHEIRYNAAYLIITTRHYILEQAKKKMSMKYLDIFANEHTQMLSSSELSQCEKTDMLKAHLCEARKGLSSAVIGRCVSLYNDSSLVGFPEITKLFSNNEELFRKGASVFSNPSKFFMSCIRDILQNKDTFLAMILIWSSPHKKLNILDLEECESRHEFKAAKKFGCKLNDRARSRVREVLEYHRNGFVTLDSQTGNYQFCHNVVSDMVGLVAGQKFQRAVLEFASEDFLMQYITTEKEHDEFHIFIEDFRFKQLNTAVGKYLFQKPFSKESPPPEQKGVDNRKGKRLPEKVKFKEMPLIVGEDSVNVAFVKHDCFHNKRYVEQFFKSDTGKRFSTIPAAMFRGQFGFYGIDVGNEMMYVHFPVRALLYGNSVLLDVFLKKFRYYSIQRVQDLHYVGLLIASHLGNVDAARLLLEHGGKVCEDAIFIAAENSDIQMLNYLLQNRGHCYSSDSNIIHKNSPLITVAKRGLTSPLECLLKHGVDVDYRNANKATALEKAILYEQYDSCKILLENEAKVNEKCGKYKRTPLHLATDIGATKLVELLLQYDAPLKVKDYRGHFPIHLAAIRCHADIVDIMLKADKSQADHRISSYGTQSLIKGMSLMHIAVWKRDSKLLEVLLENNVNPDMRDFFGRTPFYCAVYNWNHDIVTKLINVSDVTIADKNGFTPLHTAIHRGCTEIAQQICPLADVNAQDKYGKTALHTACENLNKDIFYHLVIVCNADVRILTHNGKSIMHILRDTLLRPLLSKFLTPKKFKRMSADGVRQGEVYLKANETWTSFKHIVAIKDPDFAETWIQVFSHCVPQEK